MFGKHGTVWQVGLAVLGLVIVGIVLIGPRRGTTPLVAAPAAEVANSQTAPPAQAVVQQPAGQQSSSDQSGSGQGAAPADGSAPADSGSGAEPAASTSTSMAAKASTGPATPVAAVPAVSGVGRTLFLDSFAGDPLGVGLPTGWLLADPTSSGGGLGGLPILGSLLGGLTSSTTSLVPSVVDDGTHVLSRSAGSWSHLAAGPMTVDSTASAQVKMLGQSGGFVGVAGRFQDVNNSVMCGLNGANVLQLWQIVGGREQLLASSPVTAALNVFHTITLAMQGGQMSCSLDGASLLHATGTLTSAGRIGLVALGNVTSEFSNVIDTALP